MTFSAMTDGQLLAEFLESDSEAAFEQLVRRHSAMVLDVCHYAAGNGSDCEEVVQIVFVTLARKGHLLKEHVSLAGWLHRAAWYTARRARQALRIRHAHERAAAAVCAAVERDREEMKQTKEEVHRALDALPDRYREPLILHHIEEYTVPQTAVLLSLLVTTVETRLHRGREMLRELLVERGFAVVSVSALLELLAPEETRAGAPFGFSNPPAAAGITAPFMADPLGAGAHGLTAYGTNAADVARPVFWTPRRWTTAQSAVPLPDHVDPGFGSELPLNPQGGSAMLRARDGAGLMTAAPLEYVAIGAAAIANTHLAGIFGALAAMLVLAATIVTAVGISAGRPASESHAHFTSPSSPSISPIPEPGTLALVGLGSLGLLRRPNASSRRSGISQI